MLTRIDAPQLAAGQALRQPRRHAQPRDHDGRAGGGYEGAGELACWHVSWALFFFFSPFFLSLAFFLSATGVWFSASFLVFPPVFWAWLERGLLDAERAWFPASESIPAWASSRVCCYLFLWTAVFVRGLGGMS